VTNTKTDKKQTEKRTIITTKSRPLSLQLSVRRKNTVNSKYGQGST